MRREVLAGKDRDRREGKGRERESVGRTRMKLEKINERKKG